MLFLFNCRLRQAESPPESNYARTKQLRINIIAKLDVQLIYAESLRRIEMKLFDYLKLVCANAVRLCTTHLNWIILEQFLVDICTFLFFVYTIGMSIKHEINTQKYCHGDATAADEPTAPITGSISGSGWTTNRDDTRIRVSAFVHRQMALGKKSTWTIHFDSKRSMERKLHVDVFLNSYRVRLSFPMLHAFSLNISCTKFHTWFYFF